MELICLHATKLKFHVLLCIILLNIFFAMVWKWRRIYLYTCQCTVAHSSSRWGSSQMFNYSHITTPNVVWHMMLAESCCSLCALMVYRIYAWRTRRVNCLAHVIRTLLPTIWRKMPIMTIDAIAYEMMETRQWALERPHQGDRSNACCVMRCWLLCDEDDWWYEDDREQQ